MKGTPPAAGKRWVGTGYERGYRCEPTDVWLTPPGLLAALGPFDLDPCSPADRPWDTARAHLTEAEDGLARSWSGRVWLNPPYGRQTGRWLERLADHGDGVALVFARTETEWFQRHVLGRAAAVLFLRGRLAFHRPDGSRAGNAGAPSVLVAYGERNVEALGASGPPGRLVRLDRPTDRT